MSAGKSLSETGSLIDVILKLGVYPGSIGTKNAQIASLMPYRNRWPECIRTEEAVISTHNRYSPFAQVCSILAISDYDKLGFTHILPWNDIDPFLELWSMYSVPSKSLVQILSGDCINPNESFKVFSKGNCLIPYLLLVEEKLSRMGFNEVYCHYWDESIDGKVNASKGLLKTTNARAHINGRIEVERVISFNNQITESVEYISAVSYDIFKGKIISPIKSLNEPRLLPDRNP